MNVYIVGSLDPLTEKTEELGKGDGIHELPPAAAAGDEHQRVQGMAKAVRLRPRRQDQQGRAAPCAARPAHVVGMVEGKARDEAGGQEWRWEGGSRGDG